jgi:hypothetical protein
MEIGRHSVPDPGYRGTRLLGERYHHGQDMGVSRTSGWRHKLREKEVDVIYRTELNRVNEQDLGTSVSLSACGLVRFSGFSAGSLAPHMA